MNRVLRHLAFPVSAFVVWRAVVHLIAKLGWTLDANLRNGQGIVRSEALRANPGLDALFRWDAGWYTAVATSPYSDPLHANFFPAFPFEARALAALFSADLQVTMVLAASFNALIAVIALHFLCERLIGRDGARWATIAWLAYPFSFFQATAYPESLTVAAGASALALEIAGRRWLTLPVVALSALTRHTSIYGVLAQTLWRWTRARWLERPLPLIAWGIGLACFCAVLWSRYGDPLYFITVRSQWVDGFASIVETTKHPVLMPGAIFAVLLALGSLGLLASHSTRFLFLPTLLWFALLFVNGGTGLGRHSSSVWPAFIGLGVLFARRPTWAGLIIGCTAPVGGLMLFLHSHQWHVF